MFYTYSFAGCKRDLSDIMFTVIKDEPRFISNFRPGADATQRKHEWIEDQLTGRGFTVNSISGNTLTPAENSNLNIVPGTLIAVKDDPALFKVTAVDKDSISVELVAVNGSAITDTDDLPSGGAEFIIVSTPMSEGSANGDGDESYAGSKVEWNATQIFRKEIIISGSALAVTINGSADNQLNRQTAFALSELARDLNRVALFGRRMEASPGVHGEAGGLYCFGTQENSLSINASKAVLDSFLINDGAQKVLGEGGDPMQILCSPGQARVISNEYRDRIQVLRSDDRRGAYVAVIVNEINGRGMTIMADPDVPDTDAWILDPQCFALANLSGRAITDVDATPKGFDGIRRVAIGELTFEFRNAAQRCCRLTNLKPSAEAIAALRGN
ncbi:MAG: DUF5309 family protein [Lentisphaeria bacterium]|nr:DUF5309 family protein [Lentisphaeria bacterium]